MIVEIADPKFLVGCDILKKYNACIDFSSECVKFNNKVNVKMIDLGHVLKQREVYLAQNILLKANKKSTLPVCVKKTDGEDFLANCLGIFNPNDKFDRVTGNKIIVPEHITNVLSHDILLLHVQNVSNEDISLEKNEIVGHFSMQPLENIFVCHIENNTPDPGTWDESLHINQRFDFDDIPDEEIDIHPKIPCNDFSKDATPEHIIRLKKLLTRFRNIFRVKDDGYLPAIKGFEYSVKLLPQVTSIRARPYITNPKRSQIINNLLKQYCERGLLAEANLDQYTQFSTPITLLINPNNAKCTLVGDYRSLNSWTIKDTAPITHLKNSIINLGSKRYFSVCDMLSSFSQISYSPESAKKMSLVAPDGKIFLARRLMYGTANLPATLARLLKFITTSYVEDENRKPIPPVETLVCFVDDMMAATLTVAGNIYLLYCLLGFYYNANIFLLQQVGSLFYPKTIENDICLLQMGP